MPVWPADKRWTAHNEADRLDEQFSSRPAAAYEKMQRTRRTVHQSRGRSTCCGLGQNCQRGSSVSLPPLQSHPQRMPEAAPSRWPNRARQSWSAGPVRRGPPSSRDLGMGQGRQDYPRGHIGATTRCQYGLRCYEDRDGVLREQASVAESSKK